MDREQEEQFARFDEGLVNALGQAERDPVEALNDVFATVKTSGSGLASHERAHARGFAETETQRFVAQFQRFAETFHAFASECEEHRTRVPFRAAAPADPDRTAEAPRASLTSPSRRPADRSFEEWVENPQADTRHAAASDHEMDRWCDEVGELFEDLTVPPLIRR